jgi:hypothetical protein
LKFEPETIQATVAAGTTKSFPIKLSVASDAAEGTHMIGLDITRDGVRKGELFDFLVHVGKIKSPEEAAKDGAKPGY